RPSVRDEPFHRSAFPQAGRAGVSFRLRKREWIGSPLCLDARAARPGPAVAAAACSSAMSWEPKSLRAGRFSEAVEGTGSVLKKKNPTRLISFQKRKCQACRG